MEIKERIIYYAKTVGMPISQFEKHCGMSNGYIKNFKGNLSALKLEAILSAFPEINRTWLLTGEGDMLRSTIKTSETSGIPYFAEMPVSAGNAELQLVEGDESAVGFIHIAGVTGQYAFPVVGCSMEPIIHAGDIIVVDAVDCYELIDPDKIYMIITGDDRMIKHLETDESNPDILWCVSPNYRRFSIQKADVKRIFKVTFYGRLA